MDLYVSWDDVNVLFLSCIVFYSLMQNRLMMLMYVFYVQGPAARFRIRRRIQNGSGNKVKPIQFPAWLSTNVDMLMEVLGWLPPDGMIRAASASRLFREIITSDGFRSLIRSRAKQSRHLLGLFPKCSGYPFVQCTLPRPFRRASSSVHMSWKPNNYWNHVELIDSRDGKLLLFAGQSSRSCGFVIYYPHSRKNLFSQIPRLTLLGDPSNHLVTATLVPDNNSHQFTVIVLTRKGEVDSKMTAKVPMTEASVVRFSSSTGMWGNPVTAWFQMPSKKKLHIGSLLLENKLYFLHPCEQVITVDIRNLELGTLKLPEVTNIHSRTSHVLTRVPTSDQLHLAIVAQRCIAIYSHDGNVWDLKRLNPSPGYSNSVALKLVGSTEITGLIFVKADARVIYMMEVETGLFHCISENVPQAEVLPYELEFPPVSEMLRQHP